MKYKFEEIDGNIPSYSGIYFIYRNDEIIYIGKSDCLYHRIAVHSILKRFMFAGMTHIQFIYISEKDLLKIENSLIKLFTPYLNKAANPIYIKKYNVKPRVRAW